MTAQLPSKVRLAQIASFSKSMALPPSHDEIEAMARALLAAHEQEPVAYMYRDNLHTDARFSLEPRLNNWSPEDISEYEISETPLYTHPAPVPAVPDECPRSIIEDAELYDSVEGMARSMWSAMRAAMLNGGKS